MKWLLTTAFMLLHTQTATSKEVRTHHLRRLRHNSKVRRHLAHGERRKEPENGSIDGSAQSRSAGNEAKTSITSAEVEEPYTAAQKITTAVEEPKAVSPSTTDDMSYDHWSNDMDNMELSFTTTATPALDNSDNEIAHLQLQYSSNNRHVDKMYTYGAPSVVKGLFVSNPNNACIPGLRVYNEDVEDVTCSWYNIWCTPGRKITNVDFASQINVKEGYHHPNMATLITRLVDGNKVEYDYQPCETHENNIEPYQWWPNANLPGDILQNNHLMTDHYEPRLIHVPYTVRGPSLEYISVATCINGRDNFNEIKNCLRYYDQYTPSKLNGVYPSGWEASAYMSHISDQMIDDADQVYVLKNDRDADRRKCIIGFQGSSGTLVNDFMNFIGDAHDETSYCGRNGVHSGIRNELWKITHDPQYASNIVPALETCHDVTCVGHSLGGALCNLFTMCANQGLENLEGVVDAKGWDDYNSLIWTKKKAD